MESLFSFVIPAYNCKEYLGACVESICRSCELADAAAEIILIDDGSTDGSGKLADGISRSAVFAGSKGLSCVVHHQANAGVSAARNAGIQSASGDYLIFIDSDDTLVPEKMAECLRMVRTDPEIDILIYGLAFDYYSKSKCFYTDELCPKCGGKISRKQFIDEINSHFDANCLSSLCSRITRKKLLDNALLNTDMIIYEDLEENLRILPQADVLCLYPDVVYRYRQAKKEDHGINRLKRIDDIAEVTDRIEDALKRCTDNTEHIVCSVYNVLTFNKIKGSGTKQIKEVCRQYKKWFDERGYREKNELIYSGNVSRIILRLAYSKYRHRLARFLKSSISSLRGSV